MNCAGGLDNLSPQRVQQKELVGTELGVGSGDSNCDVSADGCWRVLKRGSYQGGREMSLKAPALLWEWPIQTSKIPVGSEYLGDHLMRGVHPACGCGAKTACFAVAVALRCGGNREEIPSRLCCAGFAIADGERPSLPPAAPIAGVREESAGVREVSAGVKRCMATTEKNPLLSEFTCWFRMGFHQLVAAV